MEAIKATAQMLRPLEQGISSQAPLVSPPRESFGVILEKVFNSSEIGSGFNTRLTAIQTRALSGANFTPRDLILLQMQMGRFNMQVELVSKVAESATTTLRKIQNG